MLNVAIVGTGNISPMHIKGYLEFPERCKIVALVDIYPEKAADKKKTFDLDVDVYDNISGILGRDDIDLVSIATPPYTHAELAIQAMRAGMNVLVEKPMAASLEECDEMLKVSRETGKLLAQVAQNRFRTSVMALHDIIEQQKIGKVLMAQIDSLWWRGHSYYDLWWRGCWDKEGGGCTLNHAVHHIDMLCWMLGLPEQVTSILANVAHDNAEVEDLSIAVLRYGNGAIGQVTSSVVHHGEEQRVLFQGEKASVQVPWRAHASISKNNGFPIQNTELEAALTADFENHAVLPYEGHTAEIEDVLSALENGTKPLITGEDGRKTVELITAIYKAGFSGQTVNLPIQSDDPFYTADGMLKSVRHFYEKQGGIENFPDEDITVGSAY